MNIGLNNDEKNWLLTLYSNLKQNKKGEDDKISTIFTPKQIIEYCYGITKYLALSESQETLSKRLSSLKEETGFRVRNILHGADQGDITSGYYEDNNNNYLEYFNVDINNTLTGSFSLVSSDGLDDLCSCDFYGGGFFTDSCGDYDVMPMNDLYIETTSSSVSEEEVVNYVKNHFVILAPKTLNQINMEFMKFGFVDESGSYSIYNDEQVISISDSITGKMLFGEFPSNPEPLSLFVGDDTVIVSYDKTIPIPSESSSDPDEEEINEQQEPGAEPIEPTEPTPIEIVNGRIFYVQIQASLYLLKLMRGDFSDFDALDDIKIQLPEEQADILVNFKKYIN